MSSKRGQRGQAIPLLAVMITILIGFLGLAVDSGRAYLDRRTLQNSTDAAVLTTADYYQNGYTVAQAEQHAAASFAKNLQIYTTGSASPGWCATPSGSGTCTVNVSYAGNPHTLTLGYTDRRNVGKGLVFTATGNDSLPLTFLQALKLGPNVSLSATSQTVVGDQSQNPAILVTGTGCAPSASLNVSGGETVTVVGAIYSDGGITVGGSSQVDVQGNVYAACSQGDPSGMNLAGGYTYYSPVGKLAVNYLGGINSPYWPDYSGNSQTWPTTSMETSPGNYPSNVSITGSNCTFLDPGIYNFPAGFKDNGGLISNELRPPDEPVYNNMSQRAGSGGNGYIQFWRNPSVGVDCDGQFSVAPISTGGGSGIQQGTWSVVITSAREDVFYPSGSAVYYPRNSAPSMCRSVTVDNSGNQGLQVAISNVPGAEWYNVYAYLGTCPTNSDYSHFGYIGSVCSGQGALNAANHTYGTVAGCAASFGSSGETNSGTCPYLPSWPAAKGALPAGVGNTTNCGLGYTVSPVYSNSILTFTGGNGSFCPTTPSVGTPDYPGYASVSQGCEPPDPETCPTIVGGCATPGVTSPMPPNDPAAQWQGTSTTTGDRGDENQCSDNSGNFTSCPGNVTAGAVQFSFPAVSGACFDDEGSGGAWVFSGRQYDYIAVYSLATTSTCSGNNANKIAGGGATSWIGTTYFPYGYLTISGSAKAPISGQVVANNLTIDGSAGVTVDYNAALAPVQAAGKIIQYPCTGCS
jgi:Flp pilus assembly protein TadG